MTQFNSNEKIKSLIGAERVEGVIEHRPLATFHPMVIDFLNDLSKKLVEKSMSHMPDVVTLGFFMRKANLTRLKKRHMNPHVIMRGRGVSLHYAPSNVPLNAFYSLCAGLLSGNSCLVRLSEKKSIEVEKVIESIAMLFEDEKHRQIKQRVHLFHSPHDDQCNDYLASLCDVRVIWGGDDTITKIRQAPLKAHAIETVFPDRFSMLVINAEAYRDSSDKIKLAEAFYNDTSVFDQNACSSPKSIIWIGDEKNIEIAHNDFWQNFEAYSMRKDYRCPASKTAEKLMKVFELSQKKGVFRSTCSGATGTITVLVDKIDHEITCSGGFFIETKVSNVDAIEPINDKKLQTVTYFGLNNDEKWDLFQSMDPKILADRVVKMGQASQFDLYWDGYDLISIMSKNIVI